MLSPVTVTVCGLLPVPVAGVVQLFGPKSLNVIVPPAGAPATDGLIAGVPGWFAVPLRVAVSVTGCPRRTGPGPAVVIKVGVTGLTVKHSLGLVPLSCASGTLVVAERAPAVTSHGRYGGRAG